MGQALIQEVSSHCNNFSAECGKSNGEIPGLLLCPIFWSPVNALIEPLLKPTSNKNTRDSIYGISFLGNRARQRGWRMPWGKEINSHNHQPKPILCEMPGMPEKLANRILS